MKCQTLETQQEFLEVSKRNEKQEQVEKMGKRAEGRRLTRRERARLRKIKYPWEVKYDRARARCENPKTEMYYRYGGRGIKMVMTKEDFKFLWFRDKAFDMKNPSIDRINNNGNYELSNCRFIEMSLNVSLAKRVSIKRISPDGSIKIYDCIARANEEFGGGKTGNINSCARGRRRTAFGYRWEYEDKKFSYRELKRKPIPQETIKKIIELGRANRGVKWHKNSVGGNYKKIGEQFGLSESIVSRIVRGISHKKTPKGELHEQVRVG